MRKFFSFLFALLSLTTFAQSDYYQRKPSSELPGGTFVPTVADSAVLKLPPVWKRSVGIVLKPQYRKKVDYGYKHSTTHYFAYISFAIPGGDVRTEVESMTLYYDSHAGDRYTVQYDSLRPNTNFYVLLNEPQLDPEFTIDTAEGVIVGVSNLDVFFSYCTHDSIYKKNQQVNTDYIYNVRPDIIAGRRFRVLYEREHPNSAVIYVDQPLDTATFRYREYNNMLSLSAMPLNHITLSYARILPQHFTIYASVTPHYDPLHTAVQAGHMNYAPNKDDMYGDVDMKIKNAFSAAVGARYYFIDRAPMGPYAKLSAMAITAQVQSNYLNKSGFTHDSTAIAFASLSHENKVYSMVSTFNALGGQTGIGYSDFIDNSFHWMLDAGIGLQYYFAPSARKDSRNIAGTTYYYHDTPAWDYFLNFPMYLEVNLCYRF